MNFIFKTKCVVKKHIKNNFLKVGLLLFIILITGCGKKTMYNITFDSDGGTIIDSQVVKKGDLVKKPEDPVKDGFLFLEWTFNEKTYDFNQEVTSNITLKAKWIEDKEDNFVIKFDSNGGTSIPNKIVKKNKKLKKPTDPTKDGYVFKGWFVNDLLFDFDQEITANVILTAKWEEIELIADDPNNSANNNVNTSNNSADNNANTSNNSENNNVNTSNNSADNNANTDIKKTYTVTFNSNGGSSINSQNILEGNKVSKPVDPIKNGYIFTGWTLNGNVYDFNSIINNNIILEANWDQKVYTIKISVVDDYSPARILSVYENNNKIIVNEIRYSDGAYLCSGSNPNVNKNAIIGETSFIVVLSDGTQVIASAS